MKKERNIWRILAVFLSVCLAGGCASVTEEASRDNFFAGAESGLGDGTQVGENSSTSAEISAGGGGENISISQAELSGVLTEDGQGIYSTYQVKIGQLDGALVKEVLLAGRDITIKETEDNLYYPERTDEHYSCKDGSYVNNNFGGLKFVAAEAEYWPTPADFFELNFRELVFPDGQDLVLAQTNWDYMDMREAKDLVAGYLDKLGIEYGSQWTVFGVSGEKMTAAMHDAFPDSLYPDELVTEPVTLGETWMKTYDSEDDVYIMRIPMAFNGHLLTDAELIISDHLAYMLDEGCLIYAMVGRDGLRILEIGRLYEFIGESEEQTLIAREQAAEAAKDYIAARRAETVSLDGKYYTFEVSQVVFSYVPDIEEGEEITGEVFPCWEIRCVSWYGEDKLDYMVVFNVDAVSGEVRNTSRVFQ